MTAFVVCGDSGSTVGVGGQAAVLVDELCHRIGELATWVADGEDRLVLGVHPGEIDLGSIQAAVRRIGFDPMRIGIVDLSTVGRGGLPTALAGAAARAAKARPAAPAQVKLLPPDRSTRRALLSIGKPRYIGAPGLDPDICRAGDGCRVCVDACPVDAWSWDRGAVEHDINACVVCGLCVTACPTGAIDNPTAGGEALEAEIRAAIGHAGAPLGIRFRCRGASVPSEPGWYQVEVPCTGMLTPGWVLAPLMLGAAGVDVIACTPGGCPFRHDHRTRAMLADARAIAGRCGIRLDRPLPRPLTRPVPNGDGLFAAGATSRAIELLADPSSSESPLELGAADVGWVSIEPATCTACERCAQVCPTDALASASSDDSIVLTFDPRACTACGTCVGVCPEAARGAIELTRGFDSLDRALGRRVVREAATATCELCGGPVAPIALLQRIETMLDDNAAAAAMVSRRCLSCRGR